MIKPEQMNLYAGEVTKEILSESFPALNASLQGTKGEEMKKEFLNSLDRLFKRCITLQEQGKKEPIRYVYLFFLNASLLTETYELQFNAFSNQAYMDKVECMELWVPKLFVDFFLKDFEKLDRKVGHEVIQYNSHMRLELKRRLYAVYVVFIMNYILQTIGEVEHMESYQMMNKDKQIQIAMSGYMSESIQVWPQS